MEMLNRAIEDASDFREMVRKLEQRSDFVKSAAGPQSKPMPEWQSPRRPGENRQQHRARLRAAQKSAA